MILGLETFPRIFNILVPLIISLVIIFRASLNMMHKKKIGLFIPFFVLGFGICMVSGLIFYDFYGVAIDIFLTIKFIAIMGMVFILWRYER